MKIYNLKYFALLLATVMISCSKDDLIKEADKEAVNESNSFVFEDCINNYVIDGKITYDHKEIANAAKNAWNVHYDYPHNKVVISTTPAEFEKYKKIDTEFASRLNETTTEKEINSRVTSDQLIPGLPYHDDKLVFYYEYNVGSDSERIYHFARRNIPDVDVAFNAMLQLKTNSTPQIDDFNIMFMGMFNLPTATDNDFQIHVINHSSTSKTFTVYAGTNYNGSSRSVTTNKYSNKRLYAGTFKFQNGTDIAGSLK